MKSVRTQSGFTLIEVAIACAVASVLILLVGSLFKKSTEGLEYLTSIGQAELQMRRAIDRIVGSIAWQQAGVLYSDGPRVIARHVDGLAGGQKGFAITRVVGTSLYTVSLRVAIDLNDGTHTQLKREYRTTARIRV